MTDQIRSIFRRGFWPAGVGSVSRTPIFIVGMMRSGSTLLETILDAHPSVYGLGEDSVFNSHLPLVRNDIVQASAEGPGRVYDVVEKSAKMILKKMHKQSRELNINDSSKRKVKRMVDKMLFNYRNIGFIHLLFPHAVILHTVRDPMDTLLSCFTHKFDDNGLEWAFEPYTLVQQYVHYLQIMAHFRRELPGRVVDINYEDFVSDPETQIRSLIVDQLELEWDDRVMQFHKLNRSVHTHSMHQVRQGIFKSGVGKWTKYYQQMQPIRRLLLPHLQAMHERGDLPFKNKINWLLDPKYPYGIRNDSDTLSQQQSHSATSTVTDSGATASSIKEGENDLRDNTVRVPKSGPKLEDRLVPPKQFEGRRSGGVVFPDDEALEGRHMKRRNSREMEFNLNDYDRAAQYVNHEGDSYHSAADHVVDEAEYKPRQFGKRRRRLPSKCRRRGKRRGLARGCRARRQIVDYDDEYAPVDDDDDSVSQLETNQAFPKRSPALALKIKELSNKYDSLKSNGINIPFKHGDKVVDDLCGVGVLLFNYGRLAEAIELLEPVVAYYTNVYSAYVVLGSAHAMAGNFTEALRIMNRLVDELRSSKLEQITIDIYERRAQILVATGDFDGAIQDLTDALDLEQTAGLYFSRGNAYMKKKLYVAAKQDLLAAVTMGMNVPELWSLIGHCEREFGEPKRAIAALTKALDLDKNHKETLLELALTYMSISDSNKSLEYIARALAVDPTIKNAYGYKGLLFQNMGLVNESLAAFRAVYDLDRTDVQALHFTGVLNQAKGDYEAAIEWFDKTLEVDEEHYCWSLREIAFYRWGKLDTPLVEYNPDTDIHWLLKDAWIRRARIQNYCVPGVVSYCHHGLKLHQADDIKKLSTSSVGISMTNFYDSKNRKKEQFRNLVKMTERIAQWIQVDSPGFLRHRRQHIMFGVLVLQMAQQLRTHYRMLRNGSLPGLMIPNSAGSRRVHTGNEFPSDIDESSDTDDDYFGRDSRNSTKGVEFHALGWRDMYDIAVKWRQLAEPFDTVLWIDCTAAQENKHDKVGLQTFLYHGVGKNIRYYPYFNQTFTLMKNLLPGGYYVGNDVFEFQKPSARVVKGIERSSNLKELLEVVPALYVLTPLKSAATPEKGPLEGTRIALSHSTPAGEELYISTGTSKERYARYKKELDLSFQNIIDFAVENNAPDFEGMSNGEVQNVKDRGLELCLELYFYWINFSPLSRGTAAVGYASVVACVLSFGDILATPLPSGIQLDWEAILSSQPSDFITVARKWLESRVDANDIIEECWLREDTSCRVDATVETARDVLYVINELYESG
mmetsp:Transcript_2943/g.4462  ORF Transcript_2943/g.4462 Transcript_2943/m.4462 type:complete len:1306 (-) Transcript_2943:83-4000(-)